jgi:dihydrolipoamide dehydrogenase
LEAGVEYNKGIFPFFRQQSSRANGSTDGFVKVLADSKTDKIWDPHCGPMGEMIAESGHLY